MDWTGAAHVHVALKTEASFSGQLALTSQFLLHGTRTGWVRESLSESPVRPHASASALGVKCEPAVAYLARHPAHEINRSRMCACAAAPGSQRATAHACLTVMQFDQDLSSRNKAGSSQNSLQVTKCKRIEFD